MCFSKRLKKARESKGLTLAELGKRIGKTEATVQRYESGNIKNLKNDTIEQLADALNVNPAFLMGWIEQPDFVKENGDVYEFKMNQKISDVMTLPVISKISAGLPIYTEENIIDVIHVSKELLKTGKKHFGLLVDGDSMDKEFRDGDVVIIEKDSIIENGQIGVVMVNGYNATLKRVRYSGDMVILQPESNNPIHQPQFYNINDEIRFIGRVVGMHRKY